MKFSLLLVSSSLATQIFANANSFSPSISTSPNPSGRFIAQKGYRLYSSLEALLLQPTQDDVPIATLSNYASFGSDLKDTSSFPTFTFEKLYNYRTKWRWGFRATLGYHLKHDGWDLEANYLRFATHYNTTIINEDKNNTTLLSSPQGSPFAISSDLTNNELVRFRWGIKLNQWDLAMTKSYFVSEYLRLQPVLGLRNLLLGQCYETKSFPDLESFYTSKTQVHFWGMGALIGFNSIWNLNRQFSLIGGLKVASLFGHYHPKLNDGIAFSNSNQTVTNAEETKRTSKSVLDLSIGASWDKNFYNDKLHLGARISFEQYTYINLNQGFYGLIQDSQSGGISGRDFALQGFSFGLRTDF